VTPRFAELLYDFRRPRKSSSAVRACGPSAALPEVLLGHSKLETTALYTRIATNTIRAVMSPLERLNLNPDKNEPHA
jgi:hypothetical protein